MTIVVLVDIFGIPLTSYVGRREQHRIEFLNSLNLIADLKKDRSLRWLKERRGDIAVFSINEAVIFSSHQLISDFRLGKQKGFQVWPSKRSKMHFEKLRVFFAHVSKAYGMYERFLIFDPRTQTIVFSTDTNLIGKKAAKRLRRLKQTESNAHVSDIYLLGEQPFLDISHAIKTPNGSIVAILVGQVRVHDLFTPILHTGGQLGETGEVVLFNKAQRVLAPLKYPLPNGHYPKPLEFEITTKPDLIAAQGEDDIIETRDYRGVEVLATYRHIPVGSSVGWGMVVKRDRAELFSHLNQTISFFVLLTIVAILVFIGLTIVLSKGVTLPLMRLSKAASQLAGGNLQARCSFDQRRDEIGMLSRSFNSMAEKIQEAWKRL